MITLSTPTKDIIKELHEEEDKAVFWLKKHYHGQKGYEQMCERLKEKCEYTFKDQRSDIVEYISPKGNRWMAFTNCRYHYSINKGYCSDIAFCYYETYGSCGAFLVAHPNDMLTHDDGGAIMFTDHFFLRFCERLGVEMRSRWMIQRFVEVIPGFTFSFGDKNEQGYVKVDCRLPASLGRGILRKDGNLIEIRSYLTDKQLNNKQKRETERLRTIADKQVYEPLEVKQIRLLMSDDFNRDFQKEVLNAAEISGIDKGDVIAATNILIYITEALVDMKYAEPTDIKFWMRLRECFDYDLMFELIEKYDKKDAIGVAKILYQQVEKVGSYMGIKKYDAKAMVDKVFEVWRRHAEEYLKNKSDEE